MNREMLKLLYTLIDKDLNIANLSASTDGEKKLIAATTQKIKDDFKMISELLPVSKTDAPKEA